MRESWDYIVVGGGSAGATLAARLSEPADRRVLLIEAGGGDLSPRIRIPGLLETALTDPALNWNYQGEPDPSLGGRRLTWAAGRVIGGSSSINGMVYGRGLPADYERWVAAGNPGWGWDDMLPFFRRSERWTGPADPARGIDGPLTVRPFTETDAACGSAMAALIAAGVVQTVAGRLTFAPSARAASVPCGDPVERGVACRRFVVGHITNVQFMSYSYRSGNFETGPDADRTLTFRYRSVPSTRLGRVLQARRLLTCTTGSKTTPIRLGNETGTETKPVVVAWDPRVWCLGAVGDAEIQPIGPDLLL